MDGTTFEINSEYKLKAIETIISKVHFMFFLVLVEVINDRW